MNDENAHTLSVISFPSGSTTTISIAAGRTDKDQPHHRICITNMDMISLGLFKPPDQQGNAHPKMGHVPIQEMNWRTALRGDLCRKDAISSWIFFTYSSLPSFSSLLSACVLWLGWSLEP
jgi:hypothetical protein